MIEAVPLFGWGWFGEGDSHVEVPQPFEVEITSSVGRTIKGVVSTGAYSGWSTELWARHEQWDGYVNVRLFDADGNERVTGYATIPVEALNA